MVIGRRSKVVLATVLVLVCAACDPGWVNPVAGSGDGSGTVPGSVSVPSDQVAFSSPWALVDLGARGFLVYDSDSCTITLIAHGEGTRFAGTGVCGNSGDGGPAVDARVQVGATPLGVGLQVDPAGNVYFVSMGIVAGLRRIDAATGIISTVWADPPGLIFGLSAEADGVLTCMVYRTIEVTEGNVTSTRKVSEIHRLDATGDQLVVSLDGVLEGLPYGLFRLGPDHYVTFGFDGSGGMLRVEVDHGVVMTTPVTAPTPPGTTTPELIPATLGADGSVYAFDWDYDTNRLGAHIMRIAPDGSVDVIAGTGNPDPATGRQTGQGANLDLSVQALAVTTNGNLLIASGHAVYSMHDSDHAPSSSMVIGAPLNFFGGWGTAIDMPPGSATP